MIFKAKININMTNTQTDILLEELFGMPIERIRETSEFRNLPAWDSLTYVRLVVSVQELVGDELTAEEIEQMTSYEGLQSVVANKKQDA